MWYSFVIVVFLFTICNMLFVIFKCSTNLDLYVEYYGHRVAMYYHAPYGIVSLLIVKFY